VAGRGQLVVIAARAQIDAAGLDVGDDGGGHGARVVQHVGDGLADDVVQGQHDEQRDERPDTAARHRDALFLVQLRHRLLILLLVVAVFDLEGLDERRDAGHFEHALLALDAQGIEHKLDDEREQNERKTVVAGELIEPVQQIAEGNLDDVGDAERVLRLGGGGVGRLLRGEGCGCARGGRSRASSERAG